RCKIFVELKRFYDLVWQTVGLSFIGEVLNGTLARRQPKKLVGSYFNEREANILLLFRLVEFDLPGVIFPSFQDIKVPNLWRFVRLEIISLAIPAEPLAGRFVPGSGTQRNGVCNSRRLGNPFAALAIRLIQPDAPGHQTQQSKRAGHKSDRP